MAKGKLTAKDIVSGLDEKSSAANIRRNAEAAAKIWDKVNQKHAKDRVKDQAKIDKEYNDKLASYIKQKNKETLDDKKKNLREEYKTAVTLQEKLAISTKINAISLAQSAGKAATKAMSSLSTGIDDYLSSYSRYMSGIEARIQGSTKSFASMTGMISRNVGASQYVKQTAVLENLSRLVSEGIVYNVEQRAFLQTISDKIATTFDALDANLRQIIKIQQADSTAARLGLEARLTQFLNANFGDTSYLNSLFDSVAGALLGTSSQLGRERSVEFEYTVQKWLGSLSSVGVSETTISRLAQGLNYLGTGDIQSLASDQQLQNLLVMAAQRSGVDYAQLLTGGMSAADVNRLLSGVISFGQEIAGTTNQVVKSQYAQLFGMTISDLTSLLNLSSQDLVDISKNMLTYSEAVRETTTQIEKIPGRMSISERIETMFSNVMTSVGENIANNVGAYTTWLVNDLILKSTGGIEFDIPVPFVGFQTININKLAKTAMVGLSTLSEIGTILTGLSGANTLVDWENQWGGQDVQRRGWGFTGLRTTGTTTSSTMYIGNVAQSDIYEGSIAAAKESASETFTGTEEDSRTQMRQSIEEATNINQIRENTDNISTVITDLKILVDSISTKLSSSGFSFGQI